MKAIAHLPLLQVMLLLSVTCCALGHQHVAQNGFTSLPKEADLALSKAAATELNADIGVIVNMLMRGPRRLLLAPPAPHSKNSTNHHAKAPAPSDAPMSPMPAPGDSAAVPPACRNLTEMTPACSAALQAQQSHNVLIIVIVCAVGAFLLVAVLAWLVYQCYKSNPEQLPPKKRTGDLTKDAIKSGDPNRIAAAILQRQYDVGHTIRFPLGFMKWENIGQFGAATAGPCVMVVYYSPVLRHEAADNLRWLIRDLRDLGQLGVPEAAPFGHNRTVYGAVAGLQLSMDAEDIQVLLQKCTQDGISVHLPSGCWLEGNRDAALLPNKGMPPQERTIQYRV